MRSIDRQEPERAHRLGTEIRAEIESWNLPVVQGVRGLGLLLGIGLNPEMVGKNYGGAAQDFLYPV